MFDRLLGAAAVLCIAGSAMAGSGITINEIRTDQTGADNDEYFELAGPAGASLNDLTYLVIGDGTGVSGIIEAIVPLSGSSIPADGFFLVTESTFTLGAADLVVGTTGLNFENSDNVTHLLVSGFTGANAQDLDTNDDGVLDIMPWSTMLDSIAMVLDGGNPPTLSEWYYGPTVGPDGAFVPGHVYRFENGTGPWQIGGFALGTNDTPGVANVPAPGALALLGLGGLAAARRRRA